MLPAQGLAPDAPLGVMNILRVIVLGLFHTHTHTQPPTPTLGLCLICLWVSVHCLALPGARKALDWMMAERA